MSLEELSNLRNSINNQTNLSEEEKKTRIAVVQALMENNIIEAEYNNQMSDFINKSVQLGKLKGDSFKIDQDIRFNEFIMRNVIKESAILKEFESRGITDYTLDDIKYRIPLYEKSHGVKLTETSLAIDLLEKVDAIKQIDEKQVSTVSNKLGTILGKELVSGYTEKMTTQADGKVVIEQVLKDEEELRRDYQKAMEKINELYVNEGILDMQTQRMASDMVNQLFNSYKNGLRRVPVEAYEEMLQTDKTL